MPVYQGTPANELSAVMSADKPAVITQVPLCSPGDPALGTYLEELRKSGVSVVLIAVGDMIKDGEERRQSLENIKAEIKFFEDAGFPAAVWCNTLGFGNRRPELDRLLPGATRLTSFGGNTGGAVCTTDSLFCKMMQRNMQDYVRAGAKMILLDDELVQSVRPGFCCTCDEHLRRFERKVGRFYSREQVRDLFTGAPSPERSAYMEVMGESLLDFCKALRDAVDEVDPDVFMAICASFTHFNVEGVDMFELSKMLAGKGRRPIMRLSGAPYWSVFSQRVPGQTLGDVCDFVRMQAGWYRGRDIVLWDENDPHPRASEMVPASYCELYDKIMMANGGVHRHKYMLCYDRLSKDAAYLDAHLEDMGDDNALIKMFGGTTPLGFRVWNCEHCIDSMTLPEEYPGNWRLMGMITHSFAAEFLTENSIPSRFEGGVGAPGIAFGDQAALLPAESLEGGLVLDVPAALALQARGVDVGLDSCIPVPKQGRERFGEYVKSFGTKDGRFFKMTPRNGAEFEVLSTFESPGDTIPACVLTHTADGVFAIYAWDGHSITPGRTGDQRGLWGCPERADQLRGIYRAMSGEELPAFTRRHPGLYVLAAGTTDGSRMSVLLCNIWPDTALNLEVEVPDGWKVSGSLRTKARKDGNVVRLDKLPAYDWCAIELKVK